MAKYINALEFKKKYLEQPQGDPGVIFTVDDMPAADVAEIVHGKWIDTPLDYYKWESKCSICGWTGVSDFEGYVDVFDFCFCPNCGAKMDYDDWKESYEK